MKGRFIRRNKDGTSPNGETVTFRLINDPLAMDAEEREIIKMPIVDGRRKGIFKLIVEPWGDPLPAKTVDKTDKK
ncbi:hypothetical protein PQR39_21065 [Paraburkholderia sediminicola]|uniref:hypothetical protein n=1 Tax=Paraburkholderia sediminicola TaxID=458836 RepID=UPI0038B797D6